MNELPIDTEELFQEMKGYLAANYCPETNDDDTIHELACGEFFRIREIICRKYGFDEDLYIQGDGTSPFDFVRDDIEQEVYKRIRPEALSISDEPYRCTNCGSTDVQHKAWVRTNKNNEYVGDAWEGEPDEDDCWCDYCEGHHVIKPHREFMEEIDYWFAEELEPDDPEVITGLCECDYPSVEAYDAAVTAYWNALSDEQKINCWKALTYDKRSGDE